MCETLSNATVWVTYQGRWDKEAGLQYVKGGLRPTTVVSSVTRMSRITRRCSLCRK